MTWWLGTLRLFNGKYLWWIVLAKDALIGIPAVLTVILVNVGVFNSCWCWSAIYSRGPADAFIALTSKAGREENTRTMYPTLVFANVGLLIILVLGMRYGEGYHFRDYGGGERKKRWGSVKETCLESWPGQRIDDSKSIYVDQKRFRRGPEWRLLK